MINRLTEEQKQKIIKSLPPDYNRWTFRKVVRVRMKNAFYFRGQILKVKYFVTFGAFDSKDRYVDYYDIGKEITPSRWGKFWFWLTDNLI